MNESRSDLKRRSRRSLILRVVVAAVILMALSLCGILMLPVPQARSRQGTLDRSSLGSKAVSLDGVKVSRSAGADVGRKGMPVQVSFDLTNHGADRAFDPYEIALVVGGVSLPPFDPTARPGRTSPGVPKVLRRGKAERVGLVFAVPRGQVDATLVVQPADSPARGLTARVRLPGDAQ